MLNKLMIKLGLKREFNYSHWDIHALARILDPEVWEKVDAEIGIEGTTMDYLQFPELQRSFQQAIQILMRGDIHPATRNLMSPADVAVFQLELNVKRAEHKLTWMK